MKVHLTPSIFNKFSDVNISLLSITFPELDLTLSYGIDVHVGTPHPNKNIFVVFRKPNKLHPVRHVNGILIEVPEHIKTFSAITRWVVDGKLVTHCVNYTLADNEYDIATDDPVMWYATSEGTQKDRWPCKHETPSLFKPRFEVIIDAGKSSKVGDIKDEYNKDGFLVSRIENYLLPTIKMSHLYSDYNSSKKRMPNIKDMFNTQD